MCECDCCGKNVDERAAQSIFTKDPEGKSICLFVCGSCRATYDDEELVYNAFNKE